MYDQNKGALEEEDTDEKRVEVLAIEFDWIFSGKKAKSFISRLADTENDEIFNITTVRIIILYLWSKFFYRIFFFLFCPFMFYMATFTFYVTFVYIKKESKEFDYMDIVDYCFVAVIFAMLLFFFLIEFRQIRA